MKGLISQRLVKTVDGGRTAAIEILVDSPRVKDLIKSGKVDEIKEVMEHSETYGMQTFDQALLKLFKDGIISEENALKNADSANNLRLKMKHNDGFSSKSDFELMQDPAEVEEIEEPGEDENVGQVFSVSKKPLEVKEDS